MTIILYNSHDGKRFAKHRFSPKELNKTLRRWLEGFV